MTIPFVVTVLLVAAVWPGAAQAQPTGAAAGPGELTVVLIGTAAGPTAQPQRLGISTLVRAGSQTLLFDCGRALTTGLARLAIAPSALTRVFLTHLHSDHAVSLPELYLFAWAQGRVVPLQVRGPEGTRAMVDHLQQAFAFDIHMRRDVDEKFSADGIRAAGTDLREGVVYQADGVTVTAFVVDHGPVAPAFGYRVDYRGRSVVLSGDTKPSDNLVKFARGADVVIHELGRWKQDPVLAGPADDVVPGLGQTRRQLRTIAEHHTDGVEAGQVFARVQPKLAVFSHYNANPAATLPLVRQHYAGAVEFGEDLMTIAIGDTVTTRRFAPPAP